MRSAGRLIIHKNICPTIQFFILNHVFKTTVKSQYCTKKLYNMILLDQPYVSDYLLETIQKHDFEVIKTTVAVALVGNRDINWISEFDAIQKLENNKSQKIYSNSENAIAWVDNNLKNTNLPGKINVFKDKVKFRKLIQHLYPDYYFKGIALNQLRNLDVAEIPFPFIIKPSVGFFSLGVYRVDTIDEWKETLSSIEKEMDEVSHLYPSEVMSPKDFIIEQVIEGEEYAIDVYYKNGKPVILNIMHHIFSSGKDVSDRIYTTSKEIITANKLIFESFLSELSKLVDLEGFPIHVEVRVENGKVIPIEVNPMRFGGWCTTGDISGFAYGINSYEYFLNEKVPDWDSIFKDVGSNQYSMVILNNNSGIEADDISDFDYEAVLNDFTNVLELRKIDIHKFPLFGYMFVQTDANSQIELDRISISNLRKYVCLVM